MIVHMCKLRIVLLDEDFDPVLEGLQQLGYMHLEEAVAETTPDHIGLHRMFLSEADEQRRHLLVETRTHINELITLIRSSAAPDPGEVEACKAYPLEEIHDRALGLLRKVRSIRRRRNNLEKDKKALERYMRTGRQVRELNLFGQDADVGLFVYPAEDRFVARELKSRLQGLNIPSLQIRTFKGEAGKMIAAVVCASDQLARVCHEAWEAGTLEFKLPTTYQTSRLSDSFDLIQKDLDKVPERLAELDHELEILGAQAGHFAAALELLCSEELQRLDVRNRIVEGSYIRVLQGWAPVDKQEEIRRLIIRLTQDRVLIEELPIGIHPEEVPVILRNPRFARPFEVLLKIFPPPTYGTMDPTLINAIGVPFFFGMIVGDAAYGIIILLFALWMRHHFRQREVVRSIATIGSYCAVSTMLFGLVYGEVFGTLGHHLGLTPLLHREDPQSLILLLKLAVGLGAVHVVLGLACGILNARAMVDRHAFLERGGQLLCLLGIVFAGTGVVIHSTLLIGIAAAGFFGGVVTLLWGTGIVGLLEVFSLISNILSYARLMALGVASVVMALVANRLFQQLDFGIIGLLVATLLHSLNIMIGMFSPTIHTLRLHYVEFFSKFYQPGGKEYLRFGTKNNHA